MNLKLTERSKNQGLNRGINDFKNGYQPRNNIVKDEKGDLVADYHSVLARWRDNFSQLLNVQGDTKKRELLKSPTKIEEIQQKNFIDRN